MYSYQWFHKYQIYGVQLDPKNASGVRKSKPKPFVIPEDSDEDVSKENGVGILG
jgi:hypothetical protein